MVNSVTIILESLLHQRSCAQQFPVVTYSTSAMDRITEFCFFEDQETRDRPRN
jgi:hypothetical protein